MSLERPSSPEFDAPTLPGARAERRQRPRRKLEAQIGLHSDDQIFVGFSEDLSDAGVFVATYEDIPIGSTVRVVFELPSGVPISALGRVVWLRRASEGLAPGVGVVFEALSDAERKAILAFVSEHPPLFYDLDS